MGWSPSDEITRVYILQEMEITCKEDSDLLLRISVTKLPVEHFIAIKS